MKGMKMLEEWWRSIFEFSATFETKKIKESLHSF